MVCHAADRFRHSAHPAHGTAEVLMEARAPGWGDEGAAFLGAEHDVVVETVVG